jgi:hypothetical protein
VTLTLYKGNVIVTGRSSPKSLYSEELVTFEDDQGAYDQKDAQGFIKLNALRLRTLAARTKNSGGSPCHRRSTSPIHHQAYAAGGCAGAGDRRRHVHDGCGDPDPSRA